MIQSPHLDKLKLVFRALPYLIPGYLELDLFLLRRKLHKARQRSFLQYKDALALIKVKKDSLKPPPSV